jgi:hypothetical protein
MTNWGLDSAVGPVRGTGPTVYDVNSVGFVSETNRWKRPFFTRQDRQDEQDIFCLSGRKAKRYYLSSWDGALNNYGGRIMDGCHKDDLCNYFFAFSTEGGLPFPVFIRKTGKQNPY